MTTSRRPRHAMPDFVREAFEEHGQHLRYIDEAKRSETRARRIVKTCERLRG